jgi:hypothetical protein
MAFNLEKLLNDVFEVESGETVLVACDVPTPSSPDSPAWAERREMAAEWRAMFEAVGRTRRYETLPLLTFPATGGHGRELPGRGLLGADSVDIDALLLRTTLAVFLTEFSATAALDSVCKRREDFRAASLPGLERRMEQTALSADYREVARRCGILARLLGGASSLRVRFSTGHECTFDLRFRTPEPDDGYLPRHKPGDRIINLPSGETFIVPYEGEREHLPSTTHGIIPVHQSGGVALLRIEHNKVVAVHGDNAAASDLAAVFEADPARRNVAEVAFGCNDWAVVTGNVLEDEKAGFHWAYGRSDHLGGAVGPSAFRSPDTVVHQDIVYAKGNPISVSEAVVSRAEGPVTVMRDGAYVVF